MSYFEFHNDGPNLVSSNYWQTQHCRDGYLYLTANEGVWHLLVPEGWAGLKDMGEPRGVCITRGPFPEGGRDDMVEILFDDETDSPYHLLLGPEMITSLPPGADRTARQIVVYGPGPTELRRFPCLYRTLAGTGSALRYLRPWREDAKRPKKPKYF